MQKTVVYLAIWTASLLILPSAIGGTLSDPDLTDPVDPGFLAALDVVAAWVSFDAKAAYFTVKLRDLGSANPILDGQANARYLYLVEYKIGQSPVRSHEATIGFVETDAQGANGRGCSCFIGYVHVGTGYSDGSAPGVTSPNEVIVDLAADTLTMKFSRTAEMAAGNFLVNLKIQTFKSANPGVGSVFTNLGPDRTLVDTTAISTRAIPIP